MSDELMELPEGWDWTSFEELAEMIPNALKAGPFGSALKKSFYVPNGYKIYGQEQVINEDPHFGNYYIDETRYEELKSCAVKPGDILISLVGTIGKVLILPEGIEPGIINPRLVKLSLDRILVNNEYVKKYLESPSVRDYLSKLSHGGTMDILNLSILKTLKISLPPLNEQKRIVAAIEALRERSQNARSALSAIPELCDKFRQSVLAAAFRGDLTADWREQNPDVEPASVLLERIKGKRFKLANTRRDILSIQKVYEQEANNPPNTSELLPLTWMKCTVSSIGNVCNGSTPSRKESEYWEGSIPWVSSGEVCNNEIFETREKITKDGYSSSSVRLLPQGTVLIAMIGEGKTRGQTAILRIDATINQNIAGVALNHGLVVSEYLWYWFQSILRTKFGQVLSLKP